MTSPLSEDSKNAIRTAGAFAEANDETREVADMFGPAVLDHVKQARDCLARIIEQWERGATGTDSLVVYGYLLQHDDHMQQVKELAEAYAAFVLQTMQETKQ